ncbi:MAG: hypothetical protein KGI71_03865, partial [Patescibacteria group bacterium]|nr:hypothetical protein [Patescibacteria group bacterium]
HVIRRYFSDHYHDKKITYIEQKDLNGTGGALWLAKDMLHDRFLVMAGDDIYAEEDVEECLHPSQSWKMLVQEISEMHRAGSVVLGDDGNIADIVESTQETESRMEPGLASTSLFVVDTRLFTCPLVPKLPGSHEYGHPQTIVAAAKKLGVTLEPVFTDKWIQITAPKDLVEAAKILKNRPKKPIRAPSTPHI